MPPITASGQADERAGKFGPDRLKVFCYELSGFKQIVQQGVCVTMSSKQNTKRTRDLGAEMGYNQYI